MTLVYWEFSQGTIKVKNRFKFTPMENLVVRRETLFVGVDVHKDTHTAVGISPFGEKLFELTVGNYERDFATLAAKVEAVSQSVKLIPYFGLEDCAGFGAKLATFLVSRYPIVHVPPILVDERRKRETHPEKSDSLDALGVARVMIQRIDTLPRYTLTKATQLAKNIREISTEREYLVSERSRLKNQLHSVLHKIWNSPYQQKFKDPFTLKALRYWLRSAPKNADPFVVRAMKRKVRRLVDLRGEINELEIELKTMLADSDQTIQTASGCGTVIAAEIIGEIGDINRFTSPAALAKYAGCAPRECSSGKTKRYRKTKSGNRRLNRAFHRMALSQISRSGNYRAREYFKRKVTEGKSKQQALVCLRRQMVNLIWMMLKHKTKYMIGGYPQKNLS